MSTRKLSNVSLADYRDFLSKCNCNHIRTEGGHEVWTRKDLTRPIVVQTHIDPVPEFIIKNALRNLSLQRKDFFEILFDVKITKKQDDDETYTQINLEEILNRKL